jgi:hypothetical protein
MIKKLPYLLLFFLVLGIKSPAQEINFGDFGNYAITVDAIPGNDELSFGTVLSGEGARTINLGDNGMAVISINGVQYLDVIVTITKPNALTALDPGNNDEIPLTALNAAYTNTGMENFSQATLISGLQALFPVRQRETTPPGPPPRPPTEGFTPPQSTAYIYLGGTIDVGNIAPGEYSGFIDVTVEYN